MGCSYFKTSQNITVALYCEYAYEKASNSDKEKVCNGAGPRNFGWVVPDTIYGLSITEAANIHDWMYEYGRDLDDKERADRVFLNNMIRLINAKKKQWGFMKRLRLMRANKYYWAVCRFGGPAFSKT